MADRNKGKNNNDNRNTQTVYIPPEAREYYDRQPQYPHQPQQPQQPQRQYPQPTQQSNSNQYPPQQPYGSSQYPPQGDPYYDQPYYGDPYGRQPYYGDPRGERPRRRKHYDEQPPRRRPDQPRPKKKKKKKKRGGGISRFLTRLLLILLILFLILFGIYSCTALSLIKKMNHVETGSRTRNGSALSDSSVTNVLLIGTDGRTENESGRSDTMMLLSMNSSSDTITLTSFMRDCYVEIPNYGWDKLNASYSYGGADLVMDTIEHNFGVRIDNYVSVNFVSFANIVDAVGGIDVDISDAEAQEINTILQAEVNEIMGDDVLDDLLSGGGSEIHLNGKQALSYARIRYIGNADFERTERQRRVIELVMDKVTGFSPSAMMNISTSVLPSVDTNMSTAQLYLLSLRAPLMLGDDRQQIQIPSDGTYYGDNINGSSVLVVDFDSNYDIIKNNIYD